MAKNSAPHKPHGRVFSMAVFMLFSLALYALIHFSVLLTLEAWIPSVHLVPIIVTLWICSIAALFVARLHHDPITNIFYRVGVTWIGIAFLLFIILFPATMLAIAFGGHLSVTLLLPIAIFISIAAFLAVMTHVRTLEVAVAKLPKRMDGFKLVQLTDLHIGEIYGPDFLQTIVRKTNALKPDMIVITGDVFDGGGKPYTGMVEPLKHLHAKHGIYYVRGNHDVYEGIEETNAQLRALGNITILDDEIKSVGGLTLVGLSYPADLQDHKREVLSALAKKAKRVRPAQPIIFLRHEPRDPEFAADLGMDLMLSGHTHNGQLWPLSYLVALAYPFRVGRHRIKQMTLYIGPGIGTWGPPLRLGSRSEITLILLRHLD